MTTRFVLVGLASELSLRPLAAALSTAGYPTRVIDLAEEPANRDSLPAGSGPLVLVTSQHLAMDAQSYSAYVGFDSHYAAPQELRHRLGADLVVYVPHDLKDPVLPTEIDLLQTVDLYAAASADEWWANAHVPTVNVGWVGTASDADVDLSGVDLSSGVLFLTFVQWLMSQGGGPYVLATLEHTLASGIAVKLPVWPGLESLSECLVNHGVPVIDAQISATAISRHAPLVVTNGPSSVLAEAALAGHRPICVLSPDAQIEFRGALDDLDVVRCGDAEFDAVRPQAGRVHAPAAPFDLAAFLEAVHTMLEARRT